MNPKDYLEHKADVISAGYQDEVRWSENIQPPTSSLAMFVEIVHVILNSGMKAQVAAKIAQRVYTAISEEQPVSSVFNHPLKCRAIESAWKERYEHYNQFMKLRDADERLAWCGRLDHIGEITKYHLAKNLGVDVAKPDRHLVRLAEAAGEEVQEMCERLAKSTGDRVVTVDTVLWRACNLGLIKSLNA